jgi:hypothetical protein
MSPTNLVVEEARESADWVVAQGGTQDVGVGTRAPARPGVVGNLGDEALAPPPAPARSVVVHEDPAQVGVHVVGPRQPTPPLVDLDKAVLEQFLCLPPIAGQQ